MTKNTTNDNDRQWREVLASLERANPTSFKVNFLGSQAIVDGDRLIVSLPQSANLEWIKARQIGPVTRIAKSVYGQAFDVRFEQGESEVAAVAELEAGPPKPRTTVKGFTPVIDSLANAIGFIPAGVYGVIWRYCQMSAHNCHASQQTISEHMGIDRKTVNRHIKPLLDGGYVRCLNSHEKGKPKVYIVTNKVEIEMGWTMQARENE